MTAALTVLLFLAVLVVILVPFAVGHRRVTCSCGRRYEPEEFERLLLIGYERDGDGWAEIRRCAACNATVRAEARRNGRVGEI